MHAFLAELKVLEIEILTLRGLRLSPRTDIAEAAVKRERKVETEIADLRSQCRAEGIDSLSEVNSVHYDPDEYPEAVGFSKAPEGKE